MGKEVTIESVQAQVIAELRKAVNISDATEINFSVTIIRETDPALCTGWARIGDYEVWIYEATDSVMWEYCPINRPGEWERPIDPARIKSFTEPPEETARSARMTLVESEKEESPATDQSTQG